MCGNHPLPHSPANRTVWAGRPDGPPRRAEAARPLSAYGCSFCCGERSRPRWWWRVCGPSQGAWLFHLCVSFGLGRCPSNLTWAALYSSHGVHPTGAFSWMVGVSAARLDQAIMHFSPSISFILPPSSPTPPSWWLAWSPYRRFFVVGAPLPRRPGIQTVPVWGWLAGSTWWWWCAPPPILGDNHGS